MIFLLNQAMVSGVLARACAQGADFAELYFEDGESVSISYLRRVTDLSRTSICGVGLYLIKGLQSVYVYGNDLS